ncbi:MAG: polyketide synthase dehydratase domain-containing protein, partial [Polyangiales bacterium]
TGRLGGIDTWRPEFPALPKGTRFLEDVRFFQPGVELVVRTHLDLERDPYLVDHCYKGSYLFPTVFGLEAMAQAVAYVLRRSALPALSLHDVRLRKPLLVDPSRGLAVEVAARVIEDDSDATAVEVVIRSEQTGFTSDHFTARFVLGARLDLEREATSVLAAGTNIEPQRDLYGPILFQGPRFQRISRVRNLNSVLCLFEAAESPESAFVLGDPYLRDALLQSLQLCALPDQCLPVKIARIDIADPNRFDAGKRDCTARILAKTDDAYVGSVVCADADGEVIERLVDYHAKIIETQTNWPNAEELAKHGIVASEERNDAVAERNGWDGGAQYRDLEGYGPQNQVAFCYRFPLTAQDSTGPHGTLGFANLYRWAGKVRELSGINTPGAYSELMKMLASQDLTSATNSFETRVLGSPKPYDLIEARYWADDVTRSDVSTIYEWWRIPFPPGSSRPELVAWSRMKISAVRVLEHGQVVATQWPDFFFRFLNGMAPKNDAPTPEPDNSYELGETLLAVSARSGREPVLEDQIETGFEDANVVGNIYFANYGAWQARARDRLLHAIAPDLLRDPRPPVFLHCTGTATYHVREAVPFDNILVQTFVTKIYDRGLRLEFEYSRINDDGSLLKLASGYHEGAWVRYTDAGALGPTTWPDDAKARLLDLIGSRVLPEKAAGWP